MANWRNVGLAFLDGFAPLDNLFARPLRPGSEDELIGPAEAWVSECGADIARPSGRETEAYAAMRKRLVASIASLDSRFSSTPHDVVSGSQR